MKKPQNPPAFPSETAERQPNGCFQVRGMSLRDYMAAQVGPMLVKINSDHGVACDYRVVAESAYGYADAMLAEREKGSQ